MTFFQKREGSYIKRAVFIFLLIAVLILISRFTATDSSSEKQADNQNNYKVVEVIDGDTIVVSQAGEKKTVRLLGIDTPEARGPYRDEGCFGKEASQYLQQRLSGKEISLETDTKADLIDRFDRLLAYIYVDNVFINEELVAKGYATLYRDAENLTYTQELQSALQDAQSQNKGLWGACDL